MIPHHEPTTIDPADATTGIAAAAAPTAVPGSAKVSTRFITNVKDSDLAAAIAVILAAMTDNPAYPSPVPTLETLATTGAAFVAAMQANQGGRAQVALRDRTRTAVEDVLRQLAGYVQHACLGDRVVLLASGFQPQIVRGATPRPSMVPPTGLRAICGHASGQVLARSRAVPAALLYEWRFAPAATPDAWTYSRTQSSTRFVLEGLASATVYVLQARAYGAHGKSDWSETVTLVTS